MWLNRSIFVWPDSIANKLIPVFVRLTIFRYSTVGGSEHENAQPFVVHTNHGLLAIAHNGELVNALKLRKRVKLTCCDYIYDLMMTC